MLGWFVFEDDWWIVFTEVQQGIIGHQVVVYLRRAENYYSIFLEEINQRSRATEILQTSEDTSDTSETTQQVDTHQKHTRHKV